MTDERTVTNKKAAEELKNLNWSRLCPSADTRKFKIPRLETLVFLGDLNLVWVKSSVMSEWRRTTELLNETRHELRRIEGKTAEEIQAMHQSKDGVIHCNWRGYDYERHSVLLEKLTLKQAKKVLNKQRQRANSCRFGRNTCDWCQKLAFRRGCAINHANCRLYGPELTEEELIRAMEEDPEWWQHYSCFTTHTDCNGDEISPRSTLVPKCPHYQQCFGEQPFTREDCVLNHASDELVRDLEEHLKGKIRAYEKYRDMLNTYKARLAEAFKSATPKPEFPDCDTLPSGGVNDPVCVELYRCENGLEVRYITLGSRQEMFGRFILSFEDFIYLTQHPGFRGVWVRVGCPNALGFSTDEFLAAWEALAQANPELLAFKPLQSPYDAE